ncbi:helicase family protein with metal-binding cysteine cluster [Brachybacterium faecium DSM 4810]|uniref:Helicase family protein with metal-binding cysteine cluster n=1 Tax=Brachybacterium faecium (strain ATCC 43885 / DSM 4810 / JCM 11609 / LMG 19847 / NBRC 14762 / NCIMB 9860 / 6-10) TaxID=446465 RepID=C7MGF1_BRAFD|nr:DEAD/DEAH box helicase [Brachybacterium faecium]ACU86384.1 helicase family protein with metal-binding cysteine cluster [Brachybacterium faecium DSM 4810]
MRAGRAPELLADLSAPLIRRTCLTHVEQRPARSGRRGSFPQWTDPRLVQHLAERGITAPWIHQEQAAQLAHGGQDVVLATATASGKSLAYLLPVLTAIGAREHDPEARRATALYLSPTKALAADQLTNITAMADGAGIRDARVAVYDGDTPAEQRRWVRRHGTVVLTNPDMLHFGLLPGHEQWAHFFRALRYVVIDECHSYRGVFGSHVSMVVRRLRRIAAHYRADPTFILASATTANPELSASRLIGRDVEPVTEDGSPRAGLTIGLWEPGTRTRVDGRGDPARWDDGPGQATEGGDAEGEETDGADGADGVDGADGAGRTEEPLRRSATSEAAALLADLVERDVQTLVFARSRRGAELVSSGARRLLEQKAEHTHAPQLADRAGRVAAYRGGYLARERRELEDALRSGALKALASTNALELGIDIAGLDAVVVAGWPGTRASLWQQFGRAGRRQDADGGALALFVAREDPLDTYVVHHPETIFGAEVEAAVFDPGNPYVMTPHLCAAAAELAIRDGEAGIFGPTARDLLTTLAARGVLRSRATGWYWTMTESAHQLTDLRGSGGEPVRIVEQGTGSLLGTVDAASAHTQVHDGAVYLHQGANYVVDHLDVEQSVAFVHREDPLHTTHPQSVSTLRIRQTDRELPWEGGVRLCFGTVDVTDQVTGYQVRDVFTQAVLAQHPLDLPPRTLTTKAVWWVIPRERTDAAEIPGEELPGALHAAEHAAISMLPLLATCDRWDIGGLSAAQHEDTGEPTIFVYDGAPGGAGFAERGADDAAAWVRATADMIGECGCESGCPACVVSPKCGNGNEPLSKREAERLLGLLREKEPGATT